MNNITLAHIGGELVLIGGVAVFFHKKTATLQQKIDLLSSNFDTLTKSNEELVEAFVKLQNHVQHLTSSLMQLQQHISPTVEPPQPQSVKKTTFNMPKTPSKTFEKPSFSSLKKSAKTKPKVELEDSGDETLEDSVLDKELENESCTNDTCKERAVP